MLKSANGLTLNAVAGEDRTTTSRHMIESRRSLRGPALAAAVALAWTAFGGAGGAAAQGTVVIGTGLPEVEVHLEALDALGAGFGRAGSGQPRRLVPPGAGLGTDRVRRLAPLLVPPSRQRAAIPPPPPPRTLPIAPPVPTTPRVAARPAPAAPAPVRAPPPATALPKAPAPPVAAPKVAVPEATVATTPPPRTAAVAPSRAVAAPAAGKVLRFEFSGNSAKLPGDAAGKLSLLAEQLLASDTLRVQVKAYAGDSDGGASAARRLSLSRALAVRAFLIDKGVRSTRIDVRALGNRSDGGPPERVDVVVVKS